MYAHGHTNLGEDPGFFDKGGMFENISNVVAAGVKAGTQVYDQVKLYNQAKQGATAAQQMAASVQQAQAVANSVPQQYQQQPGFLDNWGTPLLIGGIGLAAVFMITSKKR